jgi:hypothetical protein
LYIELLSLFRAIYDSTFTLAILINIPSKKETTLAEYTYLGTRATVRNVGEGKYY